ncbi:MAG: hypothetical protein FGM15_06655 [Chthoniobacterales bacterium]|nr:hypothetical protein [Chthoniobacterales bacterium]
MDEWEAACSYEYHREVSTALATQKERVLPKAFWHHYFENRALPKDTHPLNQPQWGELDAQIRKTQLAFHNGAKKYVAQSSLFPLSEVRPANLLAHKPCPWTERVVFDVDWNATDGALLNGFKKWIADGRKEKRGGPIFFKVPQRTGPKSKAPLLCDLVALRARRAGLTMKETAELMRPFFQKAGGLGKVTNPVQRARACQNAERVIQAGIQLAFLLYDNLHEAFMLGQHRSTVKWAITNGSGGEKRAT